MSFAATLKRQFVASWRSLIRGARLPTYLGLIATFFVVWLYTTPIGWVQSLLDRLDLVIYDQRFNVVKGTLKSAENNIVIIDYDQRSLEAEGQWPWSRFKIGDMVTKLADYGVIVVGFDVFFPEYERNPVDELARRIESGADATGEAQALLPLLQSGSVAGLLDADAYFAEKMASTEVVLGYSFIKDIRTRAGTLPDSLFTLEPGLADALILEDVQGYTGNVDTLQNAASGGGYFDTQPDIDGVIRKYNMIQRYDNEVYPSLALEMARLYLLEEDFSADIEYDAQGRNPRLVGLFVGPNYIPTDPRGRVNVPYLGRQGSFPYISATDILHDTLTDEQRAQLENSLVLVGTTATGLYDLRSTPVQEVYPGVEVHANVLNAILATSPVINIDQGHVEDGVSSIQNMFSLFEEARRNPFPNRPDWASGAVTAAILLVGIGLALVYPHLGPALLALSSFTFMIGMVVLNFWLWSSYNLDFSLVILLLLILLIAVINMTYGFLKEGMSRKLIKGMFDQYVPPAHIDAMLNNPDQYNFSGESKELSVLFSDIRNFTTISEKLKATELKAMLNEFFTPITGIIFEHNGTIDKYVGDMVMAFWGAPLDDPNHRSNAVAAALAMQKKVEELKPLFRERGLPEVNIGIGINSGMMNVGDMGSTYRRAYTVIGDAVNLGSRLEGITKTYGVKVLIGEQTYDELSGFLCRQVDKVMVKGKDQPVRIYQPLCRDSEASAELRQQVDDYHVAYAHYLQQQWDAAEAGFKRLHEQDPDTYLYTLYLERIATLRQQQLPPDWDGSYRYTTK